MTSDIEGRVFVDSSGMKFQVKENGEWVTRLHFVDDLEEESESVFLERFLC